MLMAHMGICMFFVLSDSRPTKTILFIKLLRSRASVFRSCCLFNIYMYFS